MDDVNKALFAFASYNAGPARIRAMRKEAAAKGLSPNLWFHNVDTIAAARIGAEDGDLRLQHLQVLHRLPAPRRRPGRAPEGPDAVKKAG
jgi:hypothetical protein